MSNNVTSTQSTLPAALTASTSVAPKSQADQQKTQFLNLLVAQLKGQNPLDPKDGTEFVSQLAQFSSLEELINIRTTLDSFKASSTDKTDTTDTKADTKTNSTSNPFQGV